MTARTICLRLTGTPGLDGVWLMVEGRFWPKIIRQDEPQIVTLVPTGALEWDGNLCAEVYVPLDRLAEWKAEHEYEEESPWVW